MNGVIVINKPYGKTSHDAVNFIRRLTGIKKVGHTGTLDPIATGVLPICIGSATKAAEFLTASKKAYRAELILGMTTDTLDADGEILTEQPVNCTEEQIKKAVSGFIGNIRQIPPMYSAIKRDGKKLYELAREGKTVSREPREVTIYNIEIEKTDLQQGTITIYVECSKGTYIRTLCDDLGMALGCGAYMNSLERTKSGDFDIKNAYTFSELARMKEEGTLSDALMSVDRVFYDMKALKVDDRQKNFIVNGVRVRYKGLSENESYRVYDLQGNFLCISKCIDERLTLEKSFF